MIDDLPWEPNFPGAPPVPANSWFDDALIDLPSVKIFSPEEIEEVVKTPGHIIAAGGWCSPPQFIFDMMREWTIEDWKKHALEKDALRKKWKRRAKIAEAKLLLRRK